MGKRGIGCGLKNNFWQDKADLKLHRTGTCDISLLLFCLRHAQISTYDGEIRSIPK